MIPARIKRKNVHIEGCSKLDGLTTFYILMSLILAFVFADSGSSEIYVLILVFVAPAIVGLIMISLDALRNIE